MADAPGRLTDQTPELAELTKYVKERFERAEKVHRGYRERWDTWYGLYRNFRQFKRTLKGAAERDRDGIILDARREWGAELFIPYCFTVVETIVPRVISNDPRMIVLPRTEDAIEAAQRVGELIENQQKDISYDLKLQSVARSGLKYGLGVQKTFWRHEERKVTRNVPRRFMPGYQAVEQNIVLRDGPDVEPVNIWDFFWDPAASNVETADYLIHRTWRSQEYVKQKVESGQWLGIDLERVEGLASDRAQEQWSNKNRAAGVSEDQTAKGKMHEVWEYHDRGRVITVLDRELIVGNAPTPFYHREFPFQIYRPTPQEHEFVGIGEIEPIQHLQFELNTLRSQRRDNATMVLQKAFIYAQGFVDPANFKIGPGKGIPVDGANIRDVIQPLEFSDIPASSYREADEIKQDIERSSGVSDATAGGAGDGTAGSDTATGIQLVQAAANVRIALKTANLLAEAVREAGRQWLELDRQFILKQQPVRVADATQEAGFRFQRVGPKDLNADLDYPIPDATSTQPDNPPQKQNAALTLYQALANEPSVNKAKLSSYLLREYGIADAESYIFPGGTVPVNPQVLGEQLVNAGMDKNAVLQALDQALAAGTGQAPQQPSQPQPNGAASA